MHAPVDVCVETVDSAIVGVVSQLSVAVTVVAAPGTALHWTVTFDGQPLSTGAVVSWTVTTCTQDEEFPQLSVAVHVRVIV